LTPHQTSRNALFQHNTHSPLPLPIPHIAMHKTRRYNALSYSVGTSVCDAMGAKCRKSSHTGTNDQCQPNASTSQTSRHLPFAALQGSRQSRGRHANWAIDNCGSNITISKSKTDPNSKFPHFVAQPSLAQLIAHRIKSKHKLAVLVNNKLAFQCLPSWHTPSDDVLPNCHRINSEESGGEV